MRMLSSRMLVTGVALCVAAAAAFWAGRSVIELQVWAQESTPPPEVTLGFEETHYLVNPQREVLNMKRQVKTKSYAHGQGAANWKRGDLDFSFVAATDSAGKKKRTIVVSGEGFASRKTTFPSTGNDEAKARLRAELCGLRGEPQQQILGFTAYRARHVLQEREEGTIYGEQWQAPELTCASLKERVWIAYPDGEERTIKTLEPLFRRNGVEASAFEVPDDAEEVAPSKLERSVLERIEPRVAEAGGAPVDIGPSFERLDERYYQEQPLLR